MLFQTPRLIFVSYWLGMVFPWTKKLIFFTKLSNSPECRYNVAHATTNHRWKTRDWRMSHSQACDWSNGSKNHFIGWKVTQSLFLQKSDSSGWHHGDSLDSILNNQSESSLATIWSMIRNFGNTVGLIKIATIWKSLH